MKHAFTVLVAIVLSTAVIAATPPPKVTGTFSSLAYNDESSDLGGTEISIVYGGGANYAVVQCSEGEPGIPIVVKVEVSGSKISFTIPRGSNSGCPEAAYAGTVSAAGLTGQFAGFGPPELLKRKKGYWQ